ncbi:MAG: transposase [Flavobacteriaceae bacterium]|nr:transposase [Flavobacteriaceae bacterium]
MLTHKRKLILNQAQQSRIDGWIGVCRLVYNMGLEIRIASWKSRQKFVSKFELINQLPELRKIEWIADAPADSLQAVIERLDKSYQKFFKGGGFPKWAGRRKYNSMLFKRATLESNKIKLPKIGLLKMFKDSEIPGNIKTVTIKKELTGYFAYIVTDAVKEISRPIGENQAVGIDMGISSFCVTSDGHVVENPRHFKKYERKLRIEGRSLSRKKKGSSRWKKQARKLGLLHHKIGNVRKDFLHKESTKLAAKYSTVYLEDLKVGNMSRKAKPQQDESGAFIPNGQSAKSGLNRSILDAGWGMYREMLEYKITVETVNPKHTSQECFICGHISPDNRKSQSVFECTNCGHSDHADSNASKVIKGRGTAHSRERKSLDYALAVEPSFGYVSNPRRR